MTVEYSIIVPAWNEAKLLPQTLSMLTTAMAAQALPGKLIVVDNNSTDDTAAVARQYGATVVFESENNIAKARNAGAAAAGGTILIFVDADTQISPELLTETLNRMSSGEYYAWGAALAFDTPIPWFARRMTAFWNHIAPRRKLAAGCYIYCLKTTFDEVGGFSGVRYATEEIYFCRAMRKLNRKSKLKFSHIYIAPIEKCAKLREYQKGVHHGRKETMDGQGKAGNRASGLERRLQRQRIVQRSQHHASHVLQMARSAAKRWRKTV